MLSPLQIVGFLTSDCCFPHESAWEWGTKPLSCSWGTLQSLRAVSAIPAFRGAVPGHRAVPGESLIPVSAAAALGLKFKVRKEPQCSSSTCGLLVSTYLGCAIDRSSIRSSPGQRCLLELDFPHSLICPRVDCRVDGCECQVAKEKMPLMPFLWGCKL